MKCLYGMLIQKMMQFHYYVLPNASLLPNPEVPAGTSIFYQIHTQTDGKIVVSGFFDYVLNGVTKSNLVRLNSNGSIDTGFNLTFPIPDWSQILIGGQNKFANFTIKFSRCSCMNRRITFIICYCCIWLHVFVRV